MTGAGASKSRDQRLSGEPAADMIRCRMPIKWMVRSWIWRLTEFDWVASTGLNKALYRMSLQLPLEL